MILLIHPVLGPFRVHGQAIQLPAQTHCKIADIDHLLHLAIAFLQAFTHLVGYQCSQFLFFGAQCFTYLAYYLAAFWGGYVTPGFKCFGRFFNHFIIIRFVASLTEAIFFPSTGETIFFTWRPHCCPIGCLY